MTDERPQVVIAALKEAIDLRIKLYQNGCDCGVRHTCNAAQNDLYASKWAKVIATAEALTSITAVWVDEEPPARQRASLSDDELFSILGEIADEEIMRDNPALIIEVGRRILSHAASPRAEGLSDERLEVILQGLEDQGFDTLRRADKEDLLAFADLFTGDPS